MKFQNEMELTGKAKAYKSLNVTEPLQPRSHGLDFSKASNSTGDAVFTCHESLWGNDAKLKSSMALPWKISELLLPITRTSVFLNPLHSQSHEMHHSLEMTPHQRES